MTGRQLRWLLLATASGLVTFVLVRRRQQLAASLPQPLRGHMEQFEIPLPPMVPTSASEDETQTSIEVAGANHDAAPPEDEPETDGLRRKVSAGARISFRKKRYGPLPESLVGQYVDVETRADQLFILHQGTPVAIFTLQG